MKVPLRLDIAGSYTDLPGYREKGGGHINLPLDYHVQIQPGNNKNAFVRQMNVEVTKILQVPRQPLTAICNLEHGSGLGASSATVVGIVKYYAQKHNLSLSPNEIALTACKAIERMGGIVGRQDEYSAAFARPVYLYYNNKATEVQTFEWPEEFRDNIEKWHLIYIPRTISCQEMLEYEMNANLDMEPIVYFTKLMYKAILDTDWNEFWKWYVAHWKFVEKQNPNKINDDIREIRRRRHYEGIYIRPCGAGAGGYLLIHGDVEERAGETVIDLKLQTRSGGYQMEGRRL